MREKKGPDGTTCRNGEYVVVHTLQRPRILPLFKTDYKNGLHVKIQFISNLSDESDTKGERAFLVLDAKDCCVIEQAALAGGAATFLIHYANTLASADTFCKAPSRLFGVIWMERKGGETRLLLLY